MDTAEAGRPRKREGKEGKKDERGTRRTFVPRLNNMSFSRPLAGSKRFARERKIVRARAYSIIAGDPAIVRQLKGRGLNL